MSRTALLPCFSLVLAATLSGLSNVSRGDSCSPAWDQSIGQPGMFGQTGPFFGGTVLALEVFDDGSGEQVYAGGTFTMAGDQPAQHIARWNGTEWSALSGGGTSEVLVAGVPAVHALFSFDDGEGKALYAGGAFVRAGGLVVNGIARYDGQQWSALGQGMGGSSIVVRDLIEFDGELYAAGSFTQAGGQTVGHVARWDGNQWQSLGNGLNNNAVAMTVFDDGNGPALYVGGVFTGFFDASNTLVSSPYLAKWDGETWSPVGNVQLNSHVSALAVFDDGDGPALFAGGLFVWAGGTWAPRIARWDGGQWSNVGGGFNDRVRVLEVFDDGTGPALYAGGELTVADEFNDTGNGAVQVNHIARWDGMNWEALEGGVNDEVLSFVRFDHARGPQLITGGRFTEANDVDANYITIWQGCHTPGIVGDLNGDGVVNVFDLLILLEEWGACPDPDDCPADIDGDGSVDVFDLLTLLENWG